MDKICKHCGQTFDQMPGRVFSNHVRWCEENPNKDTSGIKAALKIRLDKALGEKKEFEVNCVKCNAKFLVQERELQFPLKEIYYCSRSCASKRKKSEATKAKTRETLLLRVKSNIDAGKPKAKKPRESRVCLHCNMLFEVIETSKKKYCNAKCMGADKKRTGEYVSYRHDCKFKFNLWKYPKEFDLESIKKYGWYQPSNRGNNLNGISRDHRISIRYGWENNIPAEIIAHPANCKLLRNYENISKHKKCSIILEELLIKIEEWNENYVK